MTYRCDHFRIQELVAPEIHKARGDRAWELLQVPALVTLDKLRKQFGPVIVNNWHAGGGYTESGLRVFDTGTGAKWSIHKYGGANDCKFKNVTPQEVYAYVLEHPDEFAEITTVENIEATTKPGKEPWFHFDVRNHDKPGIWVVNP